MHLVTFHHSIEWPPLFKCISCDVNPSVPELKTWKMSQCMTLTDGDNCLTERYEFLMNYAMMRSAKPDDAEPEPAWIYMEIAASPS